MTPSKSAARAAWLIAVTATAALIIAAAPASAREFPPIVLKGQSVVSVQRNYPALRPAPRQGTGNVNPTACSSVGNHTCDTIRLEADIQELHSLYGIRVTLTWPNPRTPSNKAGCDLTLGIWEKVYDTTGAENPDPTLGRIGYTGGNTDVHPETWEFGHDNPKPQVFWITVNEVAPNQNDSTLFCEAAGRPQEGYTLRVEFAQVVLDPLPDGSFRRRSGGGAFSSGAGAPGGTGAAAGGAIEEPFTAEESAASAEALKLPGPDGEMTSQQLPLYLQAEQRREDDRGRWLVTSVVVLAVAGAGLFVFFRLRARRAAA